MEQTYTYRGVVMKFDTPIGIWSGETVASSVKKARSNLEYQVKKKLGLTPQTRITLPGKIEIKQ